MLDIKYIFSYILLIRLVSTITAIIPYLNGYMVDLLVSVVTSTYMDGEYIIHQKNNYREKRMQPQLHLAAVIQ